MKLSKIKTAAMAALFGAALALPMAAQAQEAYAAGDGTTLVFYYDDQRASRTGETYDLPKSYSGPVYKKKGFTSARFDDSFKDYRPTSTIYWFYSCEAIETIEGWENLNTSEVTTMYGMFAHCKALKDIDLSHFDTSKCTVMNNMFMECKALTTIDVSYLNVENVTDFGYMFVSCGNLTTIYCPDTWTCNGNSSGMFHECWVLKGAVKYNHGQTDISMANPDTGYFTRRVVSLEAYSVLDSDQTLTFYYDPRRSSRTGTVYDLTADASTPAYCKDVLKAVFDPSFADYAPTTLSNLFAECESLTTVEGMRNLNSSQATDMSNMFKGCKSLKKLNLSLLSTSAAVDMHAMFKDCASLSTIYCDDTWTCAESTDMFLGCTSLKGAMAYDPAKIGVEMANPNTGYFTMPGSDVAEPTAYAVEAEGVLSFYYDKLCDARPGKLYDMPEAGSTPDWAGSGSDVDTSVTKVVFDSSFKGYKPSSLQCWFSYCTTLAAIEGLANLNASDVTDMYYMFIGCTSLKSITLTGLNTSSVTDMVGLFRDCTALEAIDLSGIDTGNVVDMSSMFNNCTSLKTLNISGLNTAKVKYMNHMFIYCESLESIDLSDFETPSLVIMNYMFSDCKSLKEIDLSNFDLSIVNDMDNLFADCTSLTKVNLNGLKPSGEWCSTAETFVGCTALKELDLTGFDASGVTDMNNMFNGCTGLTTIYCNDTWSCAESNDMFLDCTSLVGAVAYDPMKVNASMANPDTGYFTRKNGSIDCIEADENTTAEYYNLQGMKVAAESLTPGIYIVCRGDKTNKITVK